MGTQDRRWWLSGIEAALCVCLAVGFIPWYLLFLQRYDLRPGLRGQVDKGLALLCVLLLLGVAILALLKMSAARRRESVRRLAAQGFSDAMPEVDWTLSDSVNGPALDSVTVEWPEIRMARVAVVVRGALGAAFTLIYAVFMVAPLLDYVLLGIGIHWAPLQQLVATLYAQYRTAGVVRFPNLFGPLIFLAMFIIGVHFVVRAEARSEPKFVKVVGDQGGLTALTRWGRLIHAPWSAVTLTEVRLAHARDPRNRERVSAATVDVRAGRHLITWTVLSNESRERLTLYSHLMAALERFSGRQARAFDLGDSTPFVGERLDRAAERLGRALASTLLISAGVTTGLFLPDAGSLYIAGSIVLAVMLWFSPPYDKSRLRAAVLSRSASNPVVIAPPWQYDAQALYEMTVGSYELFRATRGLCVVLGMSVAAIGVGVALNGVTTVFSHIWWGGIGALIGGLITVVSLRARDTVVIAQQDGLRKRWLLADTLIRWQDIASIYQRANWYTVRARNSRRRIAWPVIPFDNPKTPQETGAILLNPQQMATVVEQRTGLTLQDARPL